MTTNSTIFPTDTPVIANWRGVRFVPSHCRRNDFAESKEDRIPSIGVPRLLAYSLLVVGDKSRVAFLFELDILSRLLTHGIKVLSGRLSCPDMRYQQEGVGVSKAKEKGTRIVSADAYATPAEFKQIFTEDAKSLYLLSLLLTGSHEKAEECFVEGIGQCTNGNHVFKEWARSWARRTIIQCAIRVIAPRERTASENWTADVPRVANEVPLDLHAEVCAILGLAPPERFVFVMSVLERYSDHDCSILLGLARRDIAIVRVRAMQQLATSLSLIHDSEVAAWENFAELEDTDIGLMITQHFATPAWNRTVSQ